MANLRVITPEATLSYPHLFAPRAAPGGGAAKFSATLVFAKGSNLSDLKAAVQAAGIEKWGEAKFNEMLKKKQIRLPFRDGAEKDYPDGSVFINARSDERPGVVARHAGNDGKSAPISDEREVYPGAKVRASLTAFAYDREGNKGVSFGLNNVQKLGEGERLDSRKRAEDEFTAEAVDAASLEDMLG